MKIVLPILLAGGALLAQSPVRIPQEPSLGDATKSVPPAATPQPRLLPAGHAAPGQAADHGRAPAALPASALAALAAVRPTEVLFDTPIEGGELWALGANYKASFAADRWTFVPQPAADAPAASPLRFGLQQVTVGGEPLSFATAAAVSRSGNRVTLDRGSVLEAIDLSLPQVEQSFLFASLPQRGELSVTMAVETVLHSSRHGAGIRFHDAWNDVTYSGAVAIDADGDRIDAVTELIDGGIRIRVPQSFVATATLPLVIDPVIAQTIVQTGAIDVGNADIVYAPSVDEWHVSYNQFFANGDWDCYTQRLSAAFVPVGTRAVIDFTAANIFRPKIAHLRGSNVSLVVAENRLTPIKVIGRIVDNAGVLTTGQFDIASVGVDSSFPDVGGDPFGLSPAYFTVVWDHAFTANDHDVYGRQVTALGALRGTGPTIIQGNSIDQRNPSISKSCGVPGTPSERSYVVYQQLAGSQWDIHGAMLTFDGLIIPVGGANTFPIDTSVGSQTWPQVSAPARPDSNGGRLALVVYTDESIGGGDIYMASVDTNGTVSPSQNLPLSEGRILAQTWPQGFASVDCDGSRFVVAYQELFSGTGSDLDVRVAQVSAGSGALFVQFSTAAANSGAPEFAAQVGSRYSSSGLAADRVGIACDLDFSSTFRIEADLFQTVPLGSVGQRSTACGGGVSISGPTAGQVVPGGTFNFTLSNLSPIAGFAAGEQASTPIPGCASCILGVDNYATLFGNTLPVTIPTSLSIIGAQLSVQGWMLGNPTPTSCFGSIHLSDTIDITVW
ncbi:MAG: hypothetical protein MUC36_08990 [Planctomycetes bacterium]|jgi:hypothetical protein|nr:hypothetical protein [Planctomycetota bacterium]